MVYPCSNHFALQSGTDWHFTTKACTVCVYTQDSWHS